MSQICCLDGFCHWDETLQKLIFALKKSILGDFVSKFGPEVFTSALQFYRNTIEIKSFKIIMASFIQYIQYEKVRKIVPVSLFHVLLRLLAHMGLCFLGPVFQR